MEASKTLTNTTTGRAVIAPVGFHFEALVLAVMHPNTTRLYELLAAGALSRLPISTGMVRSKDRDGALKGLCIARTSGGAHRAEIAIAFTSS